MKCLAASIAILAGLAVSMTAHPEDDPPVSQQYAEIVLTVEGMT